MPNPRKSICAIERVLEKTLQQTRPSISEIQLRPGDKVVVLDVFGCPTGIHCTVEKAGMHSVGVIWGSDTITVGRSWLRKVS
jgi:hypothetical protein